MPILLQTARTDVAYAKTRKLKATEAAYIAGLIDGEGTITLSREHKGENRRLVVSIGNAELGILRSVAKATGVGKITNKRAYSSKHTPSYAYKVTNRQALLLLEQIVMHMQSYKKRRASLALKEYLLVTPRNGRYTAKQQRVRTEFEKRFLDIKPKH